MSNTKRDKHDEVARLVYYDDDGTGKTSVERLAAILRRAYGKSAFPPPAEDARQAWKLALRTFNEKQLEGSGYKHIDIDVPGDDVAAAEIESFAQSRVEPWREAVDDFMSFEYRRGVSCQKRQMEPPLRCKCRSCIEERARALLSDSPAKEATP